MKKLFLALSILLCLSAVSSLSAEVATSDWKEVSLGTNGGLISVQWAEFNENDEITGYNGINLLGLGYASTNYFKPLELNDWNPYWHWGTVLLFIPYVGLGIDYTWDNGFFIGAKTFYILPQVELGLRF